MKGQDTLGEIEALKAEIERLKARSTVPPVQDSTPEEIEAALQAADDAYDALSDEELKQTIADRFGSRPKGHPGRDTLLNMLRSEKRRVGTECVGPCRSQWSPDHKKNITDT